jgi:cyclic pyranopterin monophosphate synthase
MNVSDLTHLDSHGRAQMVDVSEKAITSRTAAARGRLICSHATIDLVRQNRTPKGSVISTAELAGIMAAKQTSNLIPLCHPIALTKVRVEIHPDPSLPGFDILAEARTNGQTGVEMEALTAASVAALTLFDMLKAVDKKMTIEGLAVVGKSGGRSGLSYLTSVQQCD